MHSTEQVEAVRQLNSLLRGEISAAETYKMAIDKLAVSAQGTAATKVGTLKMMQEDHGRAAQSLRARICELGGEASDSSGTWGAFAMSIQWAADIFGDTAALKALKEGEEHGLKDYNAAINAVDATSRAVLESQCIPAQTRHIDLLDQLISAVGRS